MKNFEKGIDQELARKPSLDQAELMQSSQTAQINEFIEKHEKGELTQQIVRDWLDTLDEDEVEDAKNELESGIGTVVEELSQ